MTDYGQIGIAFDFVKVRLFDRKQQLVILSTTQGNGRTVEVKLFAHANKLRVEWDFIFIHPTTHTALLTQMHDF